MLALALLWLATSGLTAGALWRVVEAGQEPVLVSDGPQADAIVVLSSHRRLRKLCRVVMHRGGWEATVSTVNLAASLNT